MAVKKKTFYGQSSPLENFTWKSKRSNFSQIASFRFPRKILLKRKLTLLTNPEYTLEDQDNFVL